ncbi:hypothetical protein TcasGA2_TC015877 [Tribolium castaneum]|uniref:Uncharacterized protein n=1 Tax=Tribolium castaneum TaxID=7070 RepID=D7GXU5_TRICA|nr:hypothetical protein TcasGA2_TC015877 [Tribolium castaneum]
MRHLAKQALSLQISLCDDYSVPVDNLGNRRRPNSIAVPSFTEWNIASPNEEKFRSSKHSVVKSEDVGKRGRSGQ